MKISPSHRVAIWCCALTVFVSLFVSQAVIPVRADGPAGDGKPADPVYSHGVIAADHPLASQAGLEMLKKGGNVVDAAVATSFALSVVRPASSGIGGGGFMVIWDAKNQKAVALDYRERAPKAATREMYLKARKANPANPYPSRDGALAIAVPGNVAGLCHALEKYGSLDLPTVLAPALRYCREGIAVDPHMRSIQKTMLNRLKAEPQMRKDYAALVKHYLNGGQPWPEGARFYSPLGPVFEKIAKHGPAGFYEGEVAGALVKAIQNADGIISAEDLKSMAPTERQALRVKFEGRDILTMPPPSSGGVALLEILNIVVAYETKFPIKPRYKHNSPEFLHLLTEAMKHAYADRAEFLADSDFAQVPIKTLTSFQYAQQRAATIDQRRTFPPEYYGSKMPTKDAGTSHFSVMDAQGNAVACTETVNTLFGSLFVEPEFGIVLNNEMDDFAAIPGEPNAFGLTQSEANTVEPGKKPLSSMTPTIVLEDGQAVMALGASGGPRIISSTLQVLLNLSRFDMLPREAVAHPRIHHQWLPNVLYMENPLAKNLREPMEQYGHKVKKRNNLAVVQAILRTKKGLHAASDPRKHGRPAGY